MRGAGAEAGAPPGRLRCARVDPVWGPASARAEAAGWAPDAGAEWRGGRLRGRSPDTGAGRSGPSLGLVSAHRRSQRPPLDDRGRWGGSARGPGSGVAAGDGTAVPEGRLAVRGGRAEALGALGAQWPPAVGAGVAGSRRPTWGGAAHRWAYGFLVSIPGGRFSLSVRRRAVPGAEFWPALCSPSPDRPRPGGAARARS